MIQKFQKTHANLLKYILHSSQAAPSVGRKQDTLRQGKYGKVNTVQCNWQQLGTDLELYMSPPRIHRNDY